MTDYFIKPQCMPYFYDSNNKKHDKEPVSQNIAYTADGYLLPCCWCDAPSTRKDIEKLGLYNRRLRVSENQNVIDILNSIEWKNFVNIIMHDPANAPKCCHQKCGKRE